MLALSFVTIVSASGARAFIPEVREHSRVEPVRFVRRRSSTRPRKAVAAFFGGRKAKLGVIARAIVAHVFAPWWARDYLPVVAEPAPTARAPGQDAHVGSSLPKRKRWSILGGHGRNGVG